MTTICPQCGSERISERNIGRKAGGIVGGAAGALSGAGTGGSNRFCCSGGGDFDWGGHWHNTGEICRRCDGWRGNRSIA